MTNQKTIWIINQYAGSSVHGMEYRHYYLAKEFIAKGHKVVMISGSYSHLYKHQPTTHGDFTMEEIEGITYCWVKVPTYEKSISLGRFKNMIAFAWNLKKLPLDNFPKPDAIIVSSPSLFPIVRARKWATKFGAKLLFEIRDIWPLTLQELGNLSNFHPLILFMKWFERFGYKKSDYIISLLPNAKDHLVSNGMNEVKFKYIPNGIQIGNIQEQHKLPESILNAINPNKFLIGYAGTLGIANNLSSFIEAAKILQNDERFQFVIVGKGDQEVILKEIGKELNNLIFIESIPKHLVQEMLSKLDVCYIGLKDESLFRFGVSPNKLFDYMLSGKPILFAINSGNKPVDEANCGLSIPPENPQAIADAIIKLANLSEIERKELGENGKKYVLNNHTFSELANRYLDLL